MRRKDTQSAHSSRKYPERVVSCSPRWKGILRRSRAGSFWRQIEMHEAHDGCTSRLRKGVPRAKDSRPRGGLGARRVRLVTEGVRGGDFIAKFTRGKEKW